MNEHTCETCNFAQNDILEGPCKPCDGEGSEWKPQTRLTRISIRWDNWLGQRRNQINMLAVGIVWFVILLLMAGYMFFTTINIVARTAAELHSLQIDVHQLQERSRGR